MFSSFDSSTRWKLLLWAQPTPAKREDMVLVPMSTLTFCSSYLTIYIYIYIYKHKSFYVTICYICTHCRKRSWLFGDDSVKVKAHKIDPVVYSKMTTFRRWRWVVGFMPQLPYTWDIASCTQRKRNWVDIKVGLDALEKKTIPLRLSGIELLTVGRCFRSQVTILAELSGS